MKSLIFSILIITSMSLGWVMTAQSAPGLALSDENLETRFSLAPNQTGTPVMFIENIGQFDNRARFQVRGSDHMTWLAQDAIWISLFEPPSSRLSLEVENARPIPEVMETDWDERLPQNRVNLRLSFPGANQQARLQPFNRLDTSVNYIKGNDPADWHSAVPVWGGVRYRDLYPGLDLEITSQNGQMVQRMYVRDSSLSARHASLAMVQLRVEGAEKIESFDDRLLLTTAVGEFTMPLLEVIGAASSELPQLGIASNLVTSPFARVSPAREAIAPSDSADLLYSTYLGGTAYDVGIDIAVDSNGVAYVAGSTWSADFPTTPGAFDVSPDTSWDVFLVKLNAAGSGLDYATFIGGTTYTYIQNDYAQGIAIDSDGAVFITGYTESPDFPITPGAFDPSYNGGDYDAFALKLNESGSALDYATYLGGNDSDWGAEVAIDSFGAAYVTGGTWSADFPTTPGAFDTSYNGGHYDAFVVKLNGAGSALAYATLVGGEDSDYGSAIAVDSSRAAYITGTTSSRNFPTTPGAFAPDFNDYREAFLVKLNVAGSAQTYATFLGGSYNDDGNGIAVDPTGAAYVTGLTESSDFPTTPGAFDPIHNNWTDAFVAKFNKAGSALSYATYIGGYNDDIGNDIALDSSGAAYITGQTLSSNFPTTPGAIDNSFNYSWDDFVVKLNSAGSVLEYATFLGGSLDDKAYGITIDSSGNVIFTGETWSHDFPTTPGAFDPTFNDNFYDYWDAVVVKLALRVVSIQKIYLPQVGRD